MNKTTGYIIVILLLAILSSYLVVNFIMKEKELPAKWEYQIISFNDEEIFSSMNKFGADGWELAFARRAVSGEGYSSKGVYECIFKRLKQYQTN